MSKIEDALNKAKEARGKHTESLRVIDGASNGVSSLRNMVPNNTAPTTISHITSSKEIALMEEQALLDSKQLSELKIISPDMGDSRIANTYRDLRTKLLHKSQGKNFITMITSCVDGYSSASSALNIATAFSFEETKTSLVIDCDLCKPKLHDMLGLEIDNGLIDYLEKDQVSVESILYNTGVRRLRLIPAGSSKESASEYFTSKRLRMLMSDLLNRYSDRYIFVNTAKITDSADAKILVQLCDFVILVVPYASSTRAKVREAADEIGKEKLLGVVFSEIPNAPSLGIL